MSNPHLYRKRNGELEKWIDMEAFLMALRLRRKGILYPDIEDLFGQILVAMVETATKILLKEPEYRCRHRLFMSPDTQSFMLLQLLQELDKVNTSMQSKQVLNFILKTVQSRLRNLVRDLSRQKRNAKVFIESEMECAIDQLSLCSDFFGQRRNHFDDGKVVTQNFNNK